MASVLAGCGEKSVPQRQEDGLELVILHTNDTHSFLAGMDGYGNACLENGDCAGGLGRVAFAVKAARAQKDNVIAVDAGDQFQGTLFYSVNKWPMIADVDRVVPWDAMTLGNHEFDEGCGELARFMEKTPVPVLAANLNPEEGCPLHGGRRLPHIVRNVRGEKVAVVGLANDEVTALASACAQTRFDRAEDALAREVKELEAQGIRHIVAVTHLGLPRDRELARSVDGVDIIVGGHTHSYLGPEPSDGPYPVVEHSPDGSPVLVVTAGRGAKYLGALSVKFDGKGVPAFWSGAAVELGADTPVAPAVKELVDRYGATLRALRAEVVGEHHLSLPDGMEACREGEERCYACYRLRLEEAAAWAARLGGGYFTTTLSISPYKNARWLNEIGQELAAKYGVSYLPSDFKKKDGYRRSAQISAEHGMYRQNYCGCIFSLREREAALQGR